MFPHYSAGVKSGLLNLLKRPLVILFDGEISSGYYVLACTPDTKKGRTIKAILEEFLCLPHKSCILRDSAVAAIG